MAHKLNIPFGINITEIEGITIYCINLRMKKNPMPFNPTGCNVFEHKGFTFIRLATQDYNMWLQAKKSIMPVLERERIAKNAVKYHSYGIAMP